MTKRTIAIIGILLALAGFIAVREFGSGKKNGEEGYAVTTRNNVSLSIPLDYKQPLVVAVFDLALRISPVNASNARMIDEGKNIIRYLDAYPSVDVEQEKFPTKLKESLILKGPNHPDKFEYRVNTEDFLWEIAKNGDILFRLKEKQDRFEMEKLTKTYASLKLNMDNGDGHPVVFKIPAPFLEEMGDRGNKGDRGDVGVRIEGSTLTLTPDQDWLKSHRYPIILDPTVEAIPQESEKIELGEPSATEAKPTIRLWKWNDETYVKLGYPTEDIGIFVPEGDNKITWQSDGNVDVAVTMQEPDALAKGLNAQEGEQVSEDGGIEFDLVVKNKPKTNVFSFNLESKGLSFNYQPPLNEGPKDPRATSCTETECRDKDGMVVRSRPEHVVGSYAVYHKTKRDNYTNLGGKNYKTGKAFHIYRPKVYDAGGEWVWGNLHIDAAKGELTVTVPQKFLDEAVYPVRVDPTFGNTTIGGSSGTSADIRLTHGTPASSGDVTTISTYASGNTVTLGNAIYSDSSGPASLLAEDSGNVTLTGTAQWNDTNLSLSVTGGTKYWVAFWANSTITYYYDLGTSGDAYLKTGATFETWPNPLSGSASNRIISIYATYSLSNSAPTITSVTDTPDPTNPNRSVTFSTDWNDADSGELAKVKVCKSSTLTSQNCADGFWASSTAFTTTDPESLVYDIVGGDAGTTRNYFVHVCDDAAACTSTSTAGTFSVNAQSTVPNVKFR